MSVHHLLDTKEAFNRNELHRREFWKIAYIAGGTGQFVLGDRMWHVAPKSVLLVHPNAETSWEIDGDSLEVYNILFDSSVIQELVAELEDDFHFFEIFSPHFRQQERPAPYHVTATRRITGLVHAMHEEYQLRRKNWRSCLKLLLGEMLVLILREGEKRRIHSRPLILEFIRQRLSHGNLADFSPGKLAAEIGVSASHLSRLYRKAMGRSLRDEYMQKRMAKACCLLAETALPVSAVCADCGFSDLRNFQRHFQNLYGMPPSAFRARHPHTTPLETKP